MMRMMVKVVAASKIPERDYFFNKKRPVAQFDGVVKQALVLPKEKTVKITFAGATGPVVLKKVAALRQLIKFRHLDSKLHLHQRRNVVYIGRA